MNLVTKLATILSGNPTAAIVPPAFVPTDISGLSLWLDASDTATISHTTNAVNQWNDKSGNANHVTATTTNRPTSNTRTINSKNVLDFDGSDDVMICPSGIFAIPNGPNTVFAVYASDNVGDTKHSIFNGLNAGSGVRWAMGFTTTALEVVNRTTSALYTSQNDTRDTNPRIAGFRRSGTTITPFIGGVNGTAGTNAENITVSSMNIGAQTSGGGTNRLNGVMAELLIYNSSLSDTDMDKVGQYLATKWGLAWTNMGF